MVHAGMSTLLTPLYLVFPDAGAPAVRIYVGAVTLSLFIAAIYAVFRIAPWQFAAALAVVPDFDRLRILRPRRAVLRVVSTRQHLVLDGELLARDG